MKTSLLFLFPPFRLDVDNEQLWRGMQAIELRPKTFAVLRYLVEHPGHLVTKEEMLDAVWPQTVVGEWVLKSCVRELRKALADEAQTPQYIATVHRRGYRFIAPLSAAPPVASSQYSVVSSHSSPPTPSPQHPAPTLVGRESELAQLYHWLEKTLRGERQLIFVTGEAGIGKTTLIEVFLAGAVSSFKFSSPLLPYSVLSTQSSVLECPNPKSYIPNLVSLGRPRTVRRTLRRR